MVPLILLTVRDNVMINLKFHILILTFNSIRVRFAGPEPT